MLYAVASSEGALLAHARDLAQAREKSRARPGSHVVCADHPAGPFRRHRHLALVPSPERGTTHA